MRRRLVHPLEDEASPRLPSLGMRRCIVLLLKGEVGMRRCLVFLHCDEAVPRSLAGRQGVA
ncbi:hypothetical protein GW17_00009211 [Ensete ventricosum]|nr:hypothetical protein GW17_00009211 [Ensete ventricosum]